MCSINILLLFEVTLRSYLIALLGAITFFQTSILLAQTTKPPYLISASIHLAVDDSADIWINGVYVERCPYTPLDIDKVIEFNSSSLCYFKRENILAVKVTDTTNPPAGEDDIGFAYVMKLTFSDKTVKVITSEETEEHRSYYIPNSELTEPYGWQGMNFDASQWVPAKNSGTSIPGCSLVNSPELDQVVSFLTATSTGYSVQHLGEKHLFRRKFSLKLSQNPNCAPEPAKTFIPTAIPTRGPVKSATPRLLAAHHKPIFAPLPTPSHTPTPTATVPPPRPTFTPIPPVKKIITPIVVRLWATPTPRPVIARPRIIWPTATPTRVIVLTPTPTITFREIPTSTPVPLVPTPVFTPVMTTEISAMAVTFSLPPANVLVTFADGPGTYQVEAVDAQGRHLKTLMNQRILRTSDIWISWDGKDEQGRDVPIGRYFVLCFKEGRMLQKILLVRVP